MKSTNSSLVSFDLTPLELDIANLLPSRQVVFGRNSHSRYEKITASIEEVGIIEPLVVFPAGDGKYILLDGHLRVEACKKIGIKTVTCLVSKDDESFTYNRRINRLATIQEHLMIKKAIDRGVSEEKIAKALNIVELHLKLTHLG